jgi:CubicO group peptidase (beta-lactamase class C family)
MRRVVVLTCGVLIVGPIFNATAAHAKIVQETIDLPVDVTDAHGRKVSHPIRVEIFRDDTRAHTPFLLLNHGRAGSRTVRAGMKIEAYFEHARYFVSKGFAVFVPTRIGYGRTGGPDIEDSGACERKNYPPAYEAAAQESIAVIAYAKTQTYVDPTKGVVAGQSFGGATAIALAAKNLPGVMAAINFAGGGGGNPDKHPQHPCRDDLMGELFASYASAKIPTLWLYSENDRYWGPAIPRTWFDGFIAKGGTGKFVQLPSYKKNGHAIFYGNRAAWKTPIEDFLASCCSAVTTAQAAPASHTLEPFTHALSAWTEKYKVKQAILVVRRNGRIVHRADVGGGDPDAAYHLASLSKAITGACVATLIRDGRLAFHTPLSEALPKFLKAHGRPADRRIEGITIAQLLTHRAGFSGRNEREDAGTGANLKEYLQGHSPRDLPQPAYFASVFSARLTHEPGQRFSYSNANYLVLGAVIEEATGQAYEDYCRQAVLAPTGAEGALDPRWRVMWSYGGWRMRGADYLAFYEIFDPKRSPLGAEVIKWMITPRSKTYGKTSFPLWYGPGIRLRDAGRGVEIFHTGSWRRRLPADSIGPLTTETSTLAMRLSDGTSWFVSSTPLVLDDAREDLGDRLIQAYQSIRNWD